MKFSIITVCYNAVNDIERTIKSVLAQDFEYFEYLIVDGASTDGTLDIIKKYAKEDSRIKYTSEKDKGLYDAMNKGAKHSTGDVIEFLNAGDELYDNEVLSKVADAYDNEISKQRIVNPDYVDKLRMIFYGDIVYINEDGTEDVRVYGESCGKSIYFATGDCVNHQACFATKACMRDFLNSGRTFDEDTYKICADRDWMMRETKAGAKWIALSAILVKYQLTADSVSVADKALMRQEELTALRRHYRMYVPIYMVFNAMRNGKVLSKALHKVYELLYLRKA